MDVLKQGFNNFLGIVGNTFGKLKNTIIDGIKGILTNIKPVLEFLNVDVDKLNKSLDNLKSKDIKIKATSTTETKGDKKTVVTDFDPVAEAARVKAATEANKKRLEEQKKHNDEMLKEEMRKLDKWMADDARITELLQGAAQVRATNEKTGLDKEIQQITDKYAKEIEKFKEHTGRLAELEAARDADIQALKEKKVVEYQQRINDLRTENDNEWMRQQDEKAIADATTEEEKRLLQLESDKAFYDAQLAQSMAKELSEVVNVENAEALKSEIRAKYSLATQKSDEDFAKQSAELEKKKREAERLAIIQKTEDKLQEFNRLSEAITAMFGQSKEAATATALINGGLAVTEILKTPSVFPEPFATISRFVQIAAVVATTGKSVSQINSAKAPKSKKFFDGGYTGTDVKYNDQFFDTPPEPGDEWEQYAGWVNRYDKREGHEGFRENYYIITGEIIAVHNENVPAPQLFLLGLLEYVFASQGWKIAGDFTEDAFVKRLLLLSQKNNLCKVNIGPGPEVITWEDFEDLGLFYWRFFRYTFVPDSAGTYNFSYKVNEPLRPGGIKTDGFVSNIRHGNNVTIPSLLSLTDVYSNYNDPDNLVFEGEFSVSVSDDMAGQNYYIFYRLSNAYDYAPTIEIIRQKEAKPFNMMHPTINLGRYAPEGNQRIFYPLWVVWHCQTLNCTCGIAAGRMTR